MKHPILWALAAKRFLEFFTVNIRNRNTRTGLCSRRRRVSPLVRRARD
jgi:hypothetical protein